MRILHTTILTAWLLAVLSVPALAQTKIATVDMDKLFKGYWKTKQAEALLNERVAELQKEIKGMVDDLDKAQADYNQLLEQANDQALSAEERDKRKQSAAEKLKDINERRAAIESFGRQAQSQVADQRQRVTANLASEIQKAIADKAKAGAYTLVVNSMATIAVVYNSSDIDITDAVLKELNTGAPIDVTQPAGETSIPSLLASTNSLPPNFNPR